MKYVLVKGVHFGNKGAELMFIAIKEQFEKTRHDIRLVLAPGKQSKFERRVEHHTYQFLNLGKGKYDLNGVGGFVPVKIRDFLRQRFGIVFEVDLSAILDASGFAYGDNWPLANSLRTRKQAVRLNKNGGKYIFMPQAFGPFSRKAEIMEIATALRASYAAYARDQISRDYLANIGLELPIVEDFTSVVKSTTRDARAGLLIVPNSNMLRGKMGWSSETYVETVVRIAKRFHEKTDEPVAVMNHEGSSDQKVSENLQERVSQAIGACGLREPRDALEAKQAVAGAHIVFSSRYHACISALASGVTCIGTSWSHKYDELYKGYGAEMLLIGANEAATVERLVSDCLANREAIESRLAKKAAENITKSKAFLQDCLRAI